MKKLKWIAAGLLLLTVAIKAAVSPQGSPSSATLEQAEPISLSASDLRTLPTLSDVQLSALLDTLDAVPQISADFLPQSGTFWSLANPNWPPLPVNVNGLSVWQMSGGSFLLNDLNVDYAAPRMQTRMAMRAMGLDTPSFDETGGGSGSDTNTWAFTFDTNGLWLEIMGVSNVAALNLHNTLADVQYELLSKPDLTLTQWLSEGMVLGSELTNITPATVTVGNRTTNLFFWAKSWQDSDGSGLPDWWQMQNFGHLGVDPYGDPDGDGWSNIQEFQNSTNPNTFNTPAAPQNVTAVWNANNGNVHVTWTPAAGTVTNYLITKTDHVTGLTTTYNVSAGSGVFDDSLAGDLPPDAPDQGPALEVNYSITAQYAGGNSATGNAFLGHQTPPVVFGVRGPQGNLNLVVKGLPANTTAINVYRAIPYSTQGLLNDELYASTYDYLNDEGAVYDTLTNGYFQISASGITNGIFPVPTNNLSSFGVYHFWVQGMNGNNTNTEWSDDYVTEWESKNGPFLDARQHMKDNLRFLLRAADKNGPFEFLDVDGYNDRYLFRYPTNYVFSSLYNSGLVDEPLYPISFDATRPVVDNYMFRNFVYDANYIGFHGLPTTGIYYDYGYDRQGSVYHFLYITNYPAIFFSVGDWLQSTAPAIPASALSAAATQWLLPMNSTGGNPTSGSQHNFYGLSYLSVNAINFTNGQSTVYSPVVNVANRALYFETAQPTFQLNSYYFARVGFDPMPETNGFKVTNTTPLLVCGVGQQPYWGHEIFQVAGYAKLALQNGNSGVYGYLGQYFDQAYKIGTNGAATTNATGILSPYGEFFATEPGKAALVTMPDIDTGERGTCTVYCVSLQLDANHDGVMDLNFNGADTTSSSRPFAFWINNNYDRLELDGDDNAYYEDDVKVANSPYTPYQNTPDSEYRTAGGGRAIPTKRDLEDFARLWVCGVSSNLLASLPSGSMVTLSWGDMGGANPNHPTIDLFQAADADGGIGYLTNATVGAQQISPLTGYLGRLEPGGSIQLNAAYFNNWAGDHFIWCGVKGGSGQLFLTIADSNGNTLAQSSVWIQIKDIKQMYERWTVGDDVAQAPTITAYKAGEDLPAGVPSFEYPILQATNTPYILFVHGWNMERWDKDRFAETAFKRLYWQGYQGRFGSFRWPTGSGFTGNLWQALTDARNYDNSEYQAWQSAVGLKNMLTRLSILYPGKVYLIAHSMGNVVAGEALRLVGTNQLVNTYVASQGAVSAQVYDSTVAAPYLLEFNYQYPSGPLSAGGARNYGPSTPNIYLNWLAGNSGGVGRRINFYNENDFALAAPRWGFDQITKPDVLPSGWYGYNGTTNDASPWNHFFKFAGGNTISLDIVNNMANRYDVMAYAAESRSTALGATPGITNFVPVNLSSIWLPDVNPAFQNNPYGEHFYHSAQFRGSYWEQEGYWGALLGSDAFNLK